MSSQSVPSKPKSRVPAWRPDALPGGLVLLAGSNDRMLARTTFFSEPRTTRCLGSLRQLRDLLNGLGPAGVSLGDLGDASRQEPNHSAYPQTPASEKPEQGETTATAFMTSSEVNEIGFPKTVVTQASGNAHGAAQ